MEDKNKQLEALQDIRKMMKDSSKFLSLSGLAGIFAGIFALAGAYTGHVIIVNVAPGYWEKGELPAESYTNLVVQLLLIGMLVLSLSIVTAFYFSYSKAKKNKQKIFDHTTKKLLWTMALPLIAGGIFCLALIKHGNGFTLLISAVMLVFYGLSLLGASKFTLPEVKYLGYFEVVLGLIACFYPVYGLLLWVLGFGVLHIIYGAIMWFKYDRQ